MMKRQPKWVYWPYSTPWPLSRLLLWLVASIGISAAIIGLWLP